jgi:hypothetical protein
MLGGPEPGHEELRHRRAGGLGAAPPGEQRRHPPQGGGHHSRPQAQVVAGGARGRRLPGRVPHEIIKKNYIHVLQSFGREMCEIALSFVPQKFNFTRIS